MPDAVEALIAFTSPEAQKLYVQNGSRTAPRYSVGADPEVRRLSPSSRPSTRCPGATSCSSGRARQSRDRRDHQICGEELHDMLRGIVTPRDRAAKCPEAGREALREKTSP
jgi:multiple sugar transport system substrate-binding protein